MIELEHETIPKQNRPQNADLKPRSGGGSNPINLETIIIMAHQLALPARTLSPHRCAIDARSHARHLEWFDVSWFMVSGWRWASYGLGCWGIPLEMGNRQGLGFRV
jgi:hypothetical protein